MLSLALPLMLAAAPASDFAAADIADGRCLAAFALLASTEEKDKIAAAIPGAYYFMGRLYARNPALDLTALLQTVSKEVKRTYASELQRCSTEVAAKAQLLIDSGKTLSAEGL